MLRCAYHNSTEYLQWQGVALGCSHATTLDVGVKSARQPVSQVRGKSGESHGGFKRFWELKQQDATSCICQPRDTGDFKTDMAAVEDLIHQFLKEKGHQRVVSGRGLQQGDTAIMDLKFTEVGGALPLPGLSAERARFDTEMDPFDLTPHLLGISVGEERRFQITIPEDCSVELWQGMVCDVQAKVREIFSWILPAFDDAFVKDMSRGKFESAQEMKKSLLATTAMERVKDLDMRLGEAVQKAVVECVDIPHLPETLVLDMAATQYKALLLSMIERRQATREEVENLATEELVEEFLQKRRQEIEDLCKFNIAADEIYATEGLTLEEEDVQAEVNNRMKDYE
ncbi:uncharacterized protein HaLaN_30502, partial [Haematococcus lacustris]